MAGSDGALWFSDANTIGQVSGVGPVAHVTAGPYASIALAYEHALSQGDVLKVVASKQSETLDFNQDKSLELHGGYDAPFNAVIRYTLLSGSLTVSTGGVTIQDFVIQ